MGNLNWVLLKYHHSIYQLLHFYEKSISQKSRQKILNKSDAIYLEVKSFEILCGCDPFSTFLTMTHSISFLAALLSEYC